MSPTILSPPPTLPRSSSRRDPHASSHLLAWRSSRSRDQLITGRPLASYQDVDGCSRELFALPGHGGSTLVLDRNATTLCDRRLVAHLAADEPPENTAIICEHYISDTDGRWCRRVSREDLELAPFAQDQLECEIGHEPEARAELPQQHARIVDRNGNAYRLGLLPGERSIAQLRWCRASVRADHPGSRLPELGPDEHATPFGSTQSEAGSSEAERFETIELDRAAWEQASLREVIAALESYEPMRSLTERAIALHRDDPSVSLARLRSEFERFCVSPVVLNRGLREAVLKAIELRGTSMSEIALRCGIVKRDRRGKLSGETSWLARRIGLMPEGGETEITPWIHSDVLATIARKGLGVSPREVELQ
jgi:hypothetical protein